MASSSGGGSSAVVELERPSQVIATVAGAWGQVGGACGWPSLSRVSGGALSTVASRGQVISSIGLSAMVFSARGYAKCG